MVIIIRKRKLPVLALFLMLVGVMAVLLIRGGPAVLETASFEADACGTVYVIDAGHGGEDGGAVAADGTAESGINLNVAIRLEHLLRFFGKETRMIRKKDISVHEPGLLTFRERKASDLKQRTDLVNETDGAVLLSIHQNSLPAVPSVHGAQAFWNNKKGGRHLAEGIQSALNAAINTDKEKKPREIPESIYLMNHADAPGVLVECGFLSNAEETELLKQSAYQLRLAAAILSGTLSADIT